MSSSSKKLISAFLVLFLIAAACNLPIPPAVTDENPTQDPVEQTPTEEVRVRPQVNRIGIRTVDGVAEFHDTVTEETFIPRGVNYVDFYPTEHIGYEDRLMATNVYDPDRVRAAFRNLKEYGYNTVRIFFDNCSSGSHCFGNRFGTGLNPDYLDNMVDVMYIAGEEGIYIIFTANTAPGEGGYWQYFDDQIYNKNRLPGFETYQNADWLHPAGVEMKRRAWTDLMSGLAERDALFEAVLGWQLTNEYWLWKNNPPLSLDEGLVTISNGETYDMADPERKRQMVIDGTLYFMETIVPVIKEYDPDALTTMGFFAPQFPNQTGIGGDWYVDTAPLMDKAPIDFWDFHAYADMDIDIFKQAENFGMVGYEEKPVLLGETGMGHAFVPSAQSAATITAGWLADACEAGFDGWLYWGYYPWPEDMGGKPWVPLEDDGFLFDALAPNNWQDPCTPPDFETGNISVGKSVRASNQTGDRPARYAVDGGEKEWSAGNYPPQWLEINLQEPATVGQVGFTVGQWPPGYTHHQVWARLADNRYVLLADFNGFTTVDMSLSYKLPVPVQDVVSIRFLQLTSPSWAGYREVEVISAPSVATEACFAKANSSLRLTNYPAEDTRDIGNLKSGDEIYLGSVYRDGIGVEWARLGNNTWVETEGLAIGSGCDSANVPEADPGPRLAAVTFNVTVPEGTEGEVFIAGYFKGVNLPAWIPYMILLEKQDGDIWTIVMDLPVGTEVEYVYTRSSWETIERPASCPGDTPPRTFTVEDTPQIQRDDSVAKWRDLDC
jgi:hypothetical protein